MNKPTMLKVYKDIRGDLGYQIGGRPNLIRFADPKLKSYEVFSLICESPEGFLFDPLDKTDKYLFTLLVDQGEKSVTILDK